MDVKRGEVNGRGAGQEETGDLGSRRAEAPPAGPLPSLRFSRKEARETHFFARFLTERRGPARLGARVPAKR